jgi:hypothetical protein
MWWYCFGRSLKEIKEGYPNDIDLIIEIHKDFNDIITNGVTEFKNIFQGHVPGSLMETFTYEYRKFIINKMSESQQRVKDWMVKYNVDLTKTNF